MSHSNPRTKLLTCQLNPSWRKRKQCLVRGAGPSWSGGQHFCRARETVADRPTLSPPPRHAWLGLSHLSHVSAARVTARMPIVIGFVTRVTPVTPVTGGFGPEPGGPTDVRAGRRMSGA